MNTATHLCNSTWQWVVLALLWMTTATVYADNPSDVATTSNTWRLQMTGDYQPVADEELTLFLAAHPHVCKIPRPDSRIQPWTDANGLKHRLTFSNEQGLLRWSSASLALQQIWSEGDKAFSATEPLSEQLAVVTRSASPKSLQLIWSEPKAKRYSAVDLSDPSQPKALWQWQPSGAGSVQTPVAAVFKTAVGATHAVLVVSGTDAVQPSLWLLDAGSGALLATQQYHAAKKTVDLPFVLQDLVAAPAVLDRNADGYADRIYLVDIRGRLVQVDVDEQLQFQSRVVADLSDVGADFAVQLVASRALLPDYQMLAAKTDAVADKSSATPAAGAAGRPADLVLLVSRKNEQSQLWALTIPDSPAFTIQPHHLSSRDLGLEVDELTINSSLAGWYGTLPAAPVSLPAVFAGVIYLPMAAVSESCAQARQATELLARHAFQGSAIYSAEQLAAIPKPFGMPGAVQRNSGELALQDVRSGAILLPQLMGIRADCVFCTEALHQTLYPKWQRMAIYQHESELYK